MHIYLFKGTVTVANTAAGAATLININKKVIFKNCGPFTNCISRINNTQIDDAHDIDVVMLMYNIKEYSDNYSKTSETLWKYCVHGSVLADNGTIDDFTKANTIHNSFKIK